MIVRRDHVAGAAFVLAGLVLLAISRELPFGTMAMPGAGMMPKLVIGLMIAFGAMLAIRGADSPPMAEIDWEDFPHAARVTVAAIAAVALYTTLGFLLTSSLLLFILAALVERQSLVRAALFSVSVPLLADFLFSVVLKSPLPRGLFGF